MRLEEVLPALREGRVIRRPATHPSEVGTFEAFKITRGGLGKLTIRQHDGDWSLVDLGTDDIKSDQWEIEP